MTATPLNPNLWQVTDSDGREFHVTRIVSAGRGSSACSCGGWWLERSPEQRTCEHIHTVECAVTAPGVLQRITEGVTA